MGRQANHLAGGAQYKVRFKLGSTVANPGVVIINASTTGNAIPSSATDGGDALGLGLDTGTYSITQGDAEGLVTVDIRPDLVIAMRMSGGATEGTALTTLSETAGEAAGLTITDADVGSDDADGGTVWCTSGANVGQSRTITTHNAAQDFVVTVPFLNDIASGDQFLWCPWNNTGEGTAGNDGNGNVSLTAAFFQADVSTAAGAGIETTVVDLYLNGARDSEVLFVLRDSVYNVDTI